MDLPSTESVFDFDFTSDLGKKYEGQFTVRCLLNVRQKHLLELEKTRLLGNYVNPTDELAGMAIILASLRHRIIDAPEWWKQSDGGYNLTDIDVLNVLYEKVLTAEVEWRTKLKEKAKKLQEQTAPTATSPSSTA
jgi:hypothetical protein